MQQTKKYRRGLRKFAVSWKELFENIRQYYAQFQKKIGEKSLFLKNNIIRVFNITVFLFLFSYKIQTNTEGGQIQ